MRQIVSLFLAFLLITPLPLPARRATTTFYIDSDFAPARRLGSATNPWCSISEGWNAINAELARNDVTVYFSAREASSDTDDIYTGTSSSCGNSPGEIDMMGRTNRSTHVLTLDGNSFYNTNDSTPSWVAYSGSSRSRIRHLISQNGAHAKISYWTMSGFKVVVGGEKAVSICGDHISILNNDISQAVGANGGPAVLVVPTADSAREGSSEYCPPSDTILIANNAIHDTYGEALYIGGGGCRAADANAYDDGSGASFNVTAAGGAYTGAAISAPGSGYAVGQSLNVRGPLLGGADESNDLKVLITGVSASGGVTTFTSAGNSAGSASFTNQVATNNCMGFPAHSNVTIRNNTITNAGNRGAEGDGVDVKGGLAGLKVIGNTITASSPGARCIVSQGAGAGDPDPNNLYYGNICRNNKGLSDAGITFSDTWGRPRGVAVFNNLVHNNTGEGLHIYSCTPPFLIADNIFSTNASVGIIVSACAVTIRNNGLYNNNAGNGQASIPASATSSNNAYGGSGNGAWNGPCTSCRPGLAPADFANFANSDFRPSGTSSKLYRGGADLSSIGIPELNSAYDGTARPKGSAWDIGAH